MGSAQADIWACMACRSINAKRADRCYRCHTPRGVAAVKPAEMPFAQAALPAPAVPYRASAYRAALLSIGIVALLAAIAAAAWSFWSVIDARLTAGNAVGDLLLGQRGPLLLAPFVVGAVVLVAYAAWISRLVDNLPALGAGYARVGPRMAIAEAFLPGANVVAVIARVGEVLRRLGDPGGGTVMLGLAGILSVLPLGVGVWIIRLERFAGTVAQLMRTTSWLVVAEGACASASLLIALGLVWRVERLCRRRAAAVASVPAPAR